MKNRDESTSKEQAGSHDKRRTGQEETRRGERGDVAEPDAPTAGEGNVGMSTVLGHDPVAGVQNDAGDE